MADETVRLTEQERESIVCDCAIALAVDACPSHADDGDSLWTEQPASHILAAVEAIITAHDAEVRRTAAKETAERIAQAIEASAPTPGDAYARESLAHTRNALLSAAHIARAGAD